MMRLRSLGCRYESVDADDDGCPRCCVCAGGERACGRFALVAETFEPAERRGPARLGSEPVSSRLAPYKGLPW